MLARHKISLVLLTVGVSTATMTGAAYAAGKQQSTTTVYAGCGANQCTTNGHYSGAIALNQKIGVGVPGPGPNGHGGGGGHYTPPPATPLCNDQWINNGIDHPIYTQYKSGKVTVNGISYSWVQVRCTYTPPHSSNPFTPTPSNNRYCTPLGNYVDLAFVAQMAGGGGALAPYFGVESWAWTYPSSGAPSAVSGKVGNGTGGCAAHWLVPQAKTVVQTPSASYTWNYLLSMTPQVNLPIPTFENWTDPTVDSSWITNSFPTWPHIHANSNSGMPNAVLVNYPLLVDPQTPSTKVTGTYSVSGGSRDASASVTVGGVTYAVSAAEPITFSVPYTATFDHMDVYSGTDTSNNSAFSGLSVLVAPYNPVTPYSNFGNGTYGSTCSAGSLGTSAQMWHALPGAQQDAITNGADPMMPDGYSLTTPGYDRYGDCTITYRFPSGAGPGPNGDWPVYATGVWNVVWGNATATASSVSRTITIPPATPGGQSQSVTVTIPGSSTTSATPPNLPAMANSSPSAPLYLNVGMLEAVPVPTGTAG